MTTIVVSSNPAHGEVYVRSRPKQPCVTNHHGYVPLFIVIIQSFHWVCNKSTTTGSTGGAGTKIHNTITSLSFWNNYRGVKYYQKCDSHQSKKDRRYNGQRRKDKKTRPKRKTCDSIVYFTLYNCQILWLSF
jgi:hypothetical protein